MTKIAVRLKSRILRALAVLALFALLAVQAMAASLEEVAERVARQHDAQVVSAREVERNGQRIYVIRILTRDGVVRTIRVPARDRR